jgi:hypothetical protein
MIAHLPYTDSLRMAIPDIDISCFSVLNILKKLRKVLAEKYLNKDDKFTGLSVII